jgi:hypothetical protein
MIAAPIEARKIRSGDMHPATYDFLQQLSKDNTEFKGYTLISKEGFIARHAGHRYITSCMNSLQASPVCHYQKIKDGCRYTDSIMFTRDEQIAISDFFLSRKRFSWSHTSLPYTFHLLTKEETKCMVASNYHLSEIRYKTKGVLECSRPFFLRNDSLAIFLWQRIDDDSRGQMSVFKKGSKGWELFGEIESWEGALRLSFQ